MALASVAPPSTVVLTPVRHFWKVMFSWLAAKISRHCTSGKPASIITENWRKKMAMSLVGTLPLPSVGRAISLPFSLMVVGEMRSRRSCACSTCLFSATRSPETFSPAAVLPVNVKTGISFLPGQRFPPTDCISYPKKLALHRRCCRRTRVQSSAAVDHFLQLVSQRGALNGLLQRDLLLEIERGQRLVESLHSELVLARLHGGINLVDLVFANQIADGRVGYHDLHGHHSALPAHFGQQRLAHDAFQHQRELSADLRLLVRGKYVNDAVDGGRR